jgi:hypothetical protein
MADIATDLRQRFNWAMNLSLEAYEVLPDIGETSEHLRPPNAPTISETQAMPNPKSIML